MTHRVLNLVQQIATGTGIGALPLAGATSPQYRTMQAAGIEDSDTTYLRIQNPTNPNTEWEVSLCTYSGGVITRAFDEHSFSATGSLINFTAGNKVCSGVIVAGDLMLLSDYADVLGDVVAASDSAYEAQGAAITAGEDGLSARLSQAQYFPPDFVEESKFWTGGSGQASSPTVAANNPLPGTFIAVEDEGQVYQTEEDPETCNSFGPIGLIAGVPGSTIQLSARIRAVTDNTGGTPVVVGVSLLHLSAEFNYTMFTDGAALPTTTVADGWQQVDFSFVIPAIGDPDFSPYYRPSLFYNVVGGSTDPLMGSDDPQGNQVFQVAYFRVITGFYATLDSPNFIGAPTAPTPAALDDSNAIANTEWVNDAIATGGGAFLPKAGGTMTGPLVINKGSALTTPEKAAHVQQTWNDGADNFTAVHIDITDTASAYPSYPLRITVDGSDWLTVDQFGGLFANGALGTAGNIVAQAGTAPPAGGTAGFGYRFTSTADFGIFPGSGAPTLAAARSSIYLRTDGLPEINMDGATDWEPIATQRYVAATAMLPTIPVIRDITSGATNYVPTAGAKLARVRIKGGGGGGGGGGAGATGGGDGGDTTFGGWTAEGGEGGGGFSGGSATGGAGGSTSIPGGSPPTSWRRDGAYGSSGPGGYQFAPGGMGGGGNAGIAGSTAPQSRFADGKGGAGGGAGATAGPGAGGGEGGELEFWLAGATLTTTAYSVGAGGTAGAAGTDGAAGTAAFGGFIHIEEFF